MVKFLDADFECASKSKLPRFAMPCNSAHPQGNLGKIEYDETQSIGRRYRRQDEIGTPYCVTIDFETIKDNSVTIRHRDSMDQERINISDLSQKLTSEIYN